jgi:hypothetical protein
MLRWVFFQIFTHKKKRMFPIEIIRFIADIFSLIFLECYRLKIFAKKLFLTFGFSGSFFVI